MGESVDHDGEALFTDDYQHSTITYQDTDGPKDIDIIKTNGNLWFSGNQVMEVMGFNVNDTGHSGRTLRRIDHPDIIKIKDTPFRFTDGRRNRGSLVSPRAVMFFIEGKTKGFHPIKAVGFSSWVTDSVLEGHDADHWSPAKQEIKLLEPVFREVIVEKTEDNPELDPLRPVGRYMHLINMPPIQPDEIEFCLCEYERNGLGKCWCRRKGGIRTYLQQQIELGGKPDCVIDDDDIFEVTTEIVTRSRIKTTSVPEALASSF